jgi:tRNA threonylcarbamoyladenosine biosynthesis protein TsaB
LILGIDTTTERLHLALVRGEEAWTRGLEVGVGRSHSGTLLPTVQELLREAGASPRELSGVVACVGPGGFTSLRIGVATAEGLALTGLPTWGFSAFELRGRTLWEAGPRGPVWILLDGQRQEAFVQLWDGGAKPPAMKTPALKVPLAELSARIGSAPWWTPSGFRERASAHLPQPPLSLPDEEGATLAGLAALCRDLPGGKAEAPLVPFYLRETDAEVNFPEASSHLSEALRRGQAR